MIQDEAAAVLRTGAHRSDSLLRLSMIASKGTQPSHAERDLFNCVILPLRPFMVQ